MKQYWYNHKNAFKHINNIHYATINSTQLEARTYVSKYVQTNSQLPLLITADQQTGGIGQHNRAWYSPKNYNIYATLILEWPSDKQHLIYHLPQVTTLSISSILDKHLATFDSHSQIKWINDILINHKKIGGALCENYHDGSDHSKVLIGIGLNINMDPEELMHIDQSATSLKIETGKVWDKNIMLADILECLLNNLTQLIHEGFCPFYQTLQNKMAFINQPITLEVRDKIFEGIFSGLTPEGALVLETIQGREIFNQGRILRS